ncbi:MAG: hypothetical protein ACHQRM_17435 [Bacteroidia bacterium]
MTPSTQPFRNELIKEILSLTMLLKTQYPGVYTHLDETPFFDGQEEGQEIKSMEDYRDTLASQLEQADTENASHPQGPDSPTGLTPQ